MQGNHANNYNIDAAKIISDFCYTMTYFPIKSRVFQQYIINYIFGYINCLLPNAIKSFLTEHD
jgi:hypothetical protein